MIRQNDLFRKWMEFQNHNPPKTSGSLEDNNGRCCLGNLCHLVVPISLRIEENTDFGYVAFDGETETLPRNVRVQMNLTANANFTEAGSKIVLIWFRENNFNLPKGLPKGRSIVGLTSVNDHTTLNHQEIGELIEHLAFVEKEYGIECFFNYLASVPEDYVKNLNATY